MPDSDIRWIKIFDSSSTYGSYIEDSSHGCKIKDHAWYKLIIDGTTVINRLEDWELDESITNTFSTNGVDWSQEQGASSWSVTYPTNSNVEIYFDYEAFNYTFHTVSITCTSLLKSLILLPVVTGIINNTWMSSSIDGGSICYNANNLWTGNAIIVEAIHDSAIGFGKVFAEENYSSTDILGISEITSPQEASITTKLYSLDNTQYRTIFDAYIKQHIVSDQDFTIILHWENTTEFIPLNYPMIMDSLVLWLDNVKKTLYLVNADIDFASIFTQPVNAYVSSDYSWGIFPTTHQDVRGIYVWWENDGITHNTINISAQAQLTYFYSDATTQLYAAIENNNIKGLMLEEVTINGGKPTKDKIIPWFKSNYLFNTNYWYTGLYNANHTSPDLPPAEYEYTSFDNYPNFIFGTVPIDTVYRGK